MSGLGFRKYVNIVYEHVIWYVAGQRERLHRRCKNFLNKVYKKELHRRCKKNWRKNFGPPSLTLKKFWSPLWLTEKKLVPPFDHPKEFLSPPTNRRPPLPVKDDSSLRFQAMYSIHWHISVGSMIIESKDTTTGFGHFAPVVPYALVRIKFTFEFFIFHRQVKNFQMMSKTQLEVR